MTHLPVVVEMAQFEGQSLHVVRLQAIVVIDDVIVSGINSPPVSSLADQVEVIPAEKRGEWRKGVTKQGQTEAIHYVCLRKVSLGAGRFVREPSTGCVCKPEARSWGLQHAGLHKQTQT